MAQNTLQIAPSLPQETPTSIDRYREKKVSTKFNKPHCVIPVDDMTWVINQVKIVQTLWHECWTSDQFGSRWMKLQTSLSNKSFSLARKILYTSGLFEFKRETAIDDSRKTAGWLVMNLHGARRTADFWNKEDAPKIPSPNLPSISQEQEIPSEIIPNDGKNILILGRKNPISSSNLPCISPETLEETGVSEPLSISSISSQELLKEVSEEKKEITSNEALEGLRSRGGKNGEKLAGILVRLIKRAKGEVSEEELYKHIFEDSYRWRIDPQRLEQLLQLDNECRTYFLQSFKNVYNFGHLFGSKAFDQVINSIKSNASEITAYVKQQAEYAEFIWQRREQMFGHT